MRIPESLESLVDCGIIEEVVRPLMSGKEALVYLVVAGGQERVAKVYKETQNRTFKHRSAYTEGRKVRNSRDQRAMESRSKHGRARDEAAWRNTEVEVIYRLRDAGVRVPSPYNFIDGVLVMELVTDAEGNPAPRLGDLTFEPDQAREVFTRLLAEVVRMLCAGIVHGDLSDYNVLMGPDGPVVIDFPQAVDASSNQNAKTLLLRDVDNLHRFVSRFAPDYVPLPYAQEMWALYERSELTPDTRLTGRHRRAERPADTRAVMSLIGDAALDERKRRQALGLSMRGTSAPNEGAPAYRDDAQPRSQARHDAPRARPRQDAPRAQPPRQDPGRSADPQQQQQDAPRAQLRQEGPRSSFRQDGPRTPSRNDEPRRGQTRDDAPRHGQTRDDAPRSHERRQDVPQGEQRRQDAPYGQHRGHDAPRSQESRHEAPRSQEPRHDASRSQEPRHDAPRSQSGHGAPRVQVARPADTRSEPARHDARRSDRGDFERRGERPAAQQRPARSEAVHDQVARQGSVRDEGGHVQRDAVRPAQGEPRPERTSNARQNVRYEAKPNASRWGSAPRSEVARSERPAVRHEGSSRQGGQHEASERPQHESNARKR